MGWRQSSRRVWNFGTGKLPEKFRLGHGRYLIMEMSGQGGMGAVYLARDTQQNNRLVAIKEMSQARLKDPSELQSGRQRFQQEADMLQQLRHSNLPRVYDSFQESTRSYLVMDFIKGQTLAESLRQGQNAPLPVPLAVEYGVQLSDVLDYLHTQYPEPIIFLDLKPPNIMLREDGKVFLIDFGIARFFQRGRQTRDARVYCTPGYAPPEQMGGRPTPLSDLFALGATLHQCLTGQSPQSRTQAHIFDFPWVQTFNPQVPDKLSNLVHSLLNTDPNARPASALSVKQTLEGIRSELGKGKIRLGSPEQYDPGALTLRGSGYFPRPVPARPRPPSLPDIGAAVAAVAQRVGHGLADLGKNGVFPALVAYASLLGKQARAVLSNQKIWDRRFVVLMLTALALILGGSLSLLRTAPDAPHVVGLALICVALCVIGFHLSGKNLPDPIPRSFLGMMGLALLCVGLALQALPDIGTVASPFLQSVTLSQIVACTILAAGAVSLFRPERRLVRVDQLLLAGLAGTCALLQYGSGSSALAQLPFLPAYTIQYVNLGLVGVLCAIAFLALFCSARPFRFWSRAGLLLVAVIFTLLQYAFNLREFQHFLVQGETLIILSFVYTCGPAACALLALFIRQPWIRRPALFILALAETTMLSYLGQSIFFPSLPTNPYPPGVNILTPSTLAQVLGPVLVLVIFLSFPRTRREGSFAWLNHGALLLGAFICARLDGAFWQGQTEPLGANIDQNVLHQQFVVVAYLVPVYVIYTFLLVLPLILGAMIACHFWGQSHPFASVDRQLKFLGAAALRLERGMVLAMLSIALILQGFSGPVQAIVIPGVQQLLAGGQPDISTWLLISPIGALVLVAVCLSILLVIFLIRRPVREMGNIERLAISLALLVCLLLLWQDPALATLLAQPVQLTGNFFHWSSTALKWVILGGLLLAPFCAFFWLRRSFFTRYRNLMGLIFLLAIVSAVLQVLWPIFLPISLLFFIPDLLLAAQIEVVG